VEVNGQVLLAGAANAATVSANVNVHPSIGESWVQVTGDIVPDDSPPADAAWLSGKLKVGDAVVIRLVDSDSPSIPVLTRSDPSVAASDGVKLVCSFCGKSQGEIRKMYAGLKAVICNQCVDLMQQMAVDDKVDE
jgi:hypothetical protein